MADNEGSATSRFARAAQRLQAGTGVGVFGLVVGFLAGVLVAGVVAPRTESVVVEDPAGSGLSAAESATTDGAASTSTGQGTGTASTGPAEDQPAEPEVAAPADPDGGAQDDGASQPADASPDAGARPAGDDGGAEEQPAASEGCTSAGATAPGVTEDTIKIGVGILDISAVRFLGPEFDNGDGEEHMRAFLEGVRRDGLVPICGRDLEFVYDEYEVTDPQSQRSTCEYFAEDVEVFAVIAGSNFQEGAECIAGEKRIPLVTSDGILEEAYQRSHPFLFTLQMSATRLLRNWVHWAHHNGHFEGERFGLYWFDDARQNTLVDEVIKPELETLGYSLDCQTPAATGCLAAEATTNTELGGPEDSVAVQRFRSEDVSLAMLLTSKAGFMQNAEQQNYRPTYIESDWLSGTTNTATSTYPPEHFDGTLAMSGIRYGEWKAGLPQTERAQRCVDYYEEHSGRRVDPNEREAEWVGMNKRCDGGWVTIEALERAGAELTRQTYVRAMESLDSHLLGVHFDASFTSQRHHSPDVQRTLQWFADCQCWKAVSEVEPLWAR